MDFKDHASICEKCNSVDIAKPATLANCCWVGAPMLRDFLAAKAKPEHVKQQRALKRQFTVAADGKSYKTNKNKLDEVMRFK